MHKDARAFACKRVWEQREPILHIVHDKDGDWQFLCGGDEHTGADQAVLLHVGHVFDLFPETRQFAELEFGSYAWRDGPGDAWREFKDEP